MGVGLGWQGLPCARLLLEGKGSPLFFDPPRATLKTNAIHTADNWHLRAGRRLPGHRSRWATSAHSPFWQNPGPDCSGCCGVQTLGVSGPHLTYIVTHNHTHKIPHNALSKFTILCWATFTAILGHRWPVGRRLDTPAHPGHPGPSLLLQQLLTSVLSGGAGQCGGQGQRLWSQGPGSDLPHLLLGHRTNSFSLCLFFTCPLPGPE